jgi:hypothetical protein
MTKEQWLVYLYSIYPTGSLSIIVFAVATFVISIFWFIIDIERKKEYLPKAIKWTKIYVISLLITVIFYSLIPSKKMALAIYATPYFMKYIDNNDTKIMKLDKLLDLSLDKAIKELKIGDK